MQKYEMGATRQGRRPLWKQFARTAAAVAATIGAIAALVGCGESAGTAGNGSGGTRSGKLAIAIRWPEPSTSRLVPSAAQSIKAVLTAGTTVRATLPAVHQALGEITGRFYTTMFADNPDLLKNLFNRRGGALLPELGEGVVDGDPPAGQLARLKRACRCGAGRNREHCGGQRKRAPR